ncbi:MAG: C39 family peptidase [Lachnospiraceae bacterium]|jgi:hypothetical protein
MRKILQIITPFTTVLLIFFAFCTLCVKPLAGEQSDNEWKRYMAVLIPENYVQRNDPVNFSQQPRRKLVVIDTNNQTASESKESFSEEPEKGMADTTSGAFLPEGIMDVPYFNQNFGYYEKGQYTHGEWAYTVFEKYPDRSIPTSGCGYCASAMALTYLTGQFIAPTDIMNNGTYRYNSGMDYSGGVVAAEAYGVPAHVTNDPDEAYDALKRGFPVMALEGGLPWTDTGHYILLVGITSEGLIAVNDSAEELCTFCVNGSLWSWEDIKGPAKYAVQKAFTIFGE